MHEKHRLLCKQLAKMGSEQAADWLISTYPIEAAGRGEAILLISHRPWKRADIKKLAHYYFQELPFANGGYGAFASAMPIRTMLECVRERLPMISTPHLSLLLYHLVPDLNKVARNDSDRQLIDEFVKEVRELMGVPYNRPNSDLLLSSG